MSKFIELVQKSKGVKFGIRRDNPDGSTYGLRAEGFPDGIDGASVTKFMGAKGAVATVRVKVGESTGQGGGTLGPSSAAEAAADLINNVGPEKGE